mgnify:CR=1 FL=1
MGGPIWKKCALHKKGCRFVCLSEYELAPDGRCELNQEISSDTKTTGESRIGLFLFHSHSSSCWCSNLSGV